MMKRTALAGLAVLGGMGLGCGSSGPEAGNPLTGTWETAVSSNEFTGTVTLTFGADGSLTYALTATEILDIDCSGTETTSGLTWSSTSTDFSFGGASSCSGEFTCHSVSDACDSSTTLSAGTCDYALSNDNATLATSACTVSVPGANGTFSRM